MFGRNGDTPVPIIAACTPGDCFYADPEAVRIALEFMTPVMLLTDGYIANGAEPWMIPNVAELPITVKHPVPRPAANNDNGTPEHRSSLSCRTCGTKPWPARGRFPARPGSSTASAASKRPM